jgi:uncharacterized protein (TIGR04255 family)
MEMIPKKLLKEPLIEVIWEVRFNIPGLSEVLSGILYSELKQTHQNLKIQRLPICEIPFSIVEINPSLQYLPKIRIESNDSLLWQIGEYNITLNCRKPYIGWNRFKESINDLSEIIKNSGLITVLSRHSLRYIDLFSYNIVPELSGLQLHIHLGSYKVKNDPLQMRLEILSNNVRHIIQIANPVTVDLPDGQQTGIIVDIETIAIENKIDWFIIWDQLELLHESSKKLFFNDILAKETIEKLEPEY